jgi:sulfate-transporting ATPase
VFDELADGRDILHRRPFEMPSRAYIGRFNFKGGDQQRSSATSPAANAAACIWPRR